MSQLRRVSHDDETFVMPQAAVIVVVDALCIPLAAVLPGFGFEPDI
jgi:hypothetical protein